jgi:dGTPase
MMEADMLVDRIAYEDREESFLAGYAVLAKRSKGRKYQEDEHSFRSCFQRDRDRILYSGAFRRLQYKTQVFVNHEGDHFRTRLTHTLETSQISTSVARSLGLNEDLVNAIALAHDLGHGPFGHAGEWAISEMMKDDGGFEHNAQGLRIVEVLEDVYPGFTGLNLTLETLNGLKKHHAENAGDDYFKTLEAEVVDFSDEIAYCSHDLDDGLRSTLISEDQLQGLSIWQEALEIADKSYDQIQDRRKRMKAIRLLVNLFSRDLIEETAKRLKENRIETLSDFQNYKGPIVGFSEKKAKQHLELKHFLMKNLYQHQHVVQMTTKGQRFIKALFKAYAEQPRLLPLEILNKVKEKGPHRQICDYLAGMTDRFAVEEYKRLFQPDEKNL